MKMPLDLGVKLFFRLLLPGFFVTLGILPILLATVSSVGLQERAEVAFVLSIIVAGWLVVASDMPIYVLVEGRRFWPKSLWRLFHASECERLRRLDGAVNEYYEQKDPSDFVRRRYLEASVDKRGFPFGPDGRRQAPHPTRLGNLIASYENYSKSRYGVEAVFYWPRVWVNLSKDLREEIDGQQAMADSATYSFVALVVAAICWTSYGGLSLLTGFLGAISTGVMGPLVWWALNLSEWLPDAPTCFLFALVTLLSARCVYHLAVFTNAQFGEVFMAAFDAHVRRLDGEYMDVKSIARKAIGVASHQGEDGLEDRFEIARRYLQYRNVMLPGKSRPVLFEEVQARSQPGTRDDRFPQETKGPSHQ